MTKTFTIRPLCLGVMKREKRNMAYRCPEDAVLEFPLISYYLEGDDHKVIVDTGGSAPDDKKWQPYFRSENEEMDRALLNTGVSPRDIDIVILTHLHWDHAGNNMLFPEARFFVQAKELDFVLSADPEEKAGFELDLIKQTSYESVNGDCEIVPGISALLAPGHTVGMQCVAVETTMGKYILGGDLITLFENWEARPHIPGGIFYDLDTVINSLNKIDEINASILPGHDPKVFKQSVYP